MNAVEFLMPPVLATMFVPPLGVIPRLVFLLAVGKPELATTRTEDLERVLDCEECLKEEREEKAYEDVVCVVVCALWEVAVTVPEVESVFPLSSPVAVFEAEDEIED
jgi:hypothetical protein